MNPFSTGRADGTEMADQRAPPGAPSGIDIRAVDVLGKHLAGVQPVRVPAGVNPIAIAITP